MFRTYTDWVRTPKQSNYSSDCFEGFKCNMCDTGKFITETDVEIHKKTVHWDEISNEMVKYRERFCTTCMSLLPSYCKLISHIKSEHLLSAPTAKAVEREIFICHHCHHIFFNKTLMEVHIQYMHMYTTDEKRKTKMAKCPKCLKSISLKALWFHLQLHELPSISACDICLTNFPNRQLLFEHLKNHLCYYKCVICNFNTTKEDLYNQHLQGHKKRTYERKKYIENFVRRSFKRKTKDIKFNIHSSLRGLMLPSVIDICTICRFICTDKVDMKIHILRDHMGRTQEIKRKHMCACGQEFFNKVLLKQHVLKMKGFHRVLEDGEEPETPMVEPQGDIGEIVYNITDNADDRPIYVIEAINVEDEEQDALNISDIEIPSEPTNADEVLG